MSTACPDDHLDDDTELAAFMHVFDHVLRTPLAALRGHLELVRDHSAELPAEVVRSLEVMSRAVDRLESAIESGVGLQAVTVGLRSVG